MIYRFENCVLDTGRRELRRGNLLQPIEPQVFDLLDYLIRNRDRIVSRDDIFAAVWHGRIVSDATLATRINAARRAAGDNGAEQRLIKTFYGRGLRFVGQVREESVAATPISFAPSRRRFSLAVKDVPAIVVLPFAVTAPDAESIFLAEGLTEEVTTALAKCDWLLVLARHLLTGRGAASKQAAGELKARYVLQGGIRKLNGRARVTAKLIDRTNGCHVWADSYDDDIGHAFHVQDNIARAISAAVEDQIFAAEAMRAKLKSPEGLSAWEYIAGALALMNTRQKQHVRAARSQLCKAIAIDPHSAHAYSLLSFVTTLSVHLGWNSREASKPMAFRAARKALSLDSDEAWGHVALGYATLHTANQTEEAIEILNDALKLEPNLSVAHYFIALASTYASGPDAAFRHADLAEQLAPRDLLARGNAGAPNNVRATASFVAGRYRDGMAYARKALAQSPRQVPAFRQIVTNGSLAGEHEQAAMALKTVKRLAPDVEQWLKESEPIYSRKEDYQKYVEGFRMAVLR
ncbi:MAG: winged helix-turn-helix domain-containing protein [Pseudolabrys sp.]